MAADPLNSTTPHTPSPASDPSNSNSDVVDGVTEDNGGGREEGDVELALFRRIRSFSNMSTGLASSCTFPTENSGYQHYFQHPLSMFSSTTTTRDDANVNAKVQGSGQKSESSSTSDRSAKKVEKKTGKGQSRTIDKKENDVKSEGNFEDAMPGGVEWRDALIQACAALLGKKQSELEAEYVAAASVASARAATFATHQPQFEPSPRDLADYAIISALKRQDALSMQNATSWLFNMMDRTGAGYVLRDEFTRYAPFITPIADFAVSGIVFDELVREQARLAGADASSLPSVGFNPSPVNPTTSKAIDNLKASKSDENSNLRQRKGSNNKDHGKQDKKWENERYCSAKRQDSASTRGQPEPKSGDALCPDLFPPGGALRYDLWRRFFDAVQDKYHYADDDWVRVKREVGIDPDEMLIKSQGSLDHSDLFPTLGKLYLSQRYLIFFAAVGRNHYVIRLGAVAQISSDSIPFMMRDCMRITLESEVKIAIDGVSAVVKEDEEVDEQGEHGSKAHPSNNGNETTTSQHVGKLMKKFSSGRKPLVFSLLEFREKKRRDNWVNLVREMVAAHKLHAQLGFGSAGRMVRTVQMAPRNAGGIDIDIIEDQPDGEVDEKRNPEKERTVTLNYSRSPFRNEPSPPLLAVAAHSNIVRYRALRRVTEKRVSGSLLIFSRAERNVSLVNWYTDSVRAYESQSGRTWVERALSVIRDNMDSNERIYRIEDDEPFDVGKLGDAIGRFAELCAPLARVMQNFNHLIQWRNPAATILAILLCMTIAFKGLVYYVPAFLIFLQAAWVVETKYNFLGLRMAGVEAGDAKEEQRNVLELVAQVHDTLVAAQNVLSKLNRELGKVQAVFLWGCNTDAESWIAVGGLCIAALIVAVLPLRVMFLCFVFFLFFKHFLPPSNPVLRYWQALPSKIVRKELDVHRGESLVQKAKVHKKG